MSSRDCYAVLGVERNASSDEIRRRYRKLAMKYHPDRNKGDKNTEQKFKEVQKAYEILSDNEKRSAYDQYGDAAFSGSFAGAAGAAGAEDVFGSMFKGFEEFFGGHSSARGRRSTAHPGQDILYEIELTLEEAAFGGEKKITLDTWRKCNRCGGDGCDAGSSPETCTTCHGRGQVTFKQGFFVMQQTCHDCRGAGTVIRRPCRECSGSGRVKKGKSLSVKIPAGVDEGDRIRLAGEGHAGEGGGESGNLYIDTVIKTHHLFTRDKCDLHVNVPISFPSAVLGDSVQVPSLGGEQLKLTVPKGTQSEKLFRIRGKGIQNPHNRSVGDLFCRVQIETPVDLTEEQIGWMKKFRDSLHSSGGRNSPKCESWIDKVKNFIGHIR